MDRTPKFRTTKIKPYKVFLQCSNCEKDIRQIFENDKINVTRAYYCKDCDDGAIHLNPPTLKKPEEPS